jgi:hypothetical protein
MSTFVSVTNHGLLVRRFLQLGDGANVASAASFVSKTGVYNYLHQVPRTTGLSQP